MSDVDLPMPSGALEQAESLDAEKGLIRSGKLAGLSMWSAIWTLAIPVMIQQTLQALVGMADKVFAGQLPHEMVKPALDAVGVGSYVNWFMGVALTGLGIGGQALIARAIGGGDSREAHRSLGQAMTLSIIWGVVVGVVLWLIVMPLARMCGLSGEAAIYCRQYIQYMAYAMPFSGIMLVGSMCLYGAGETTRPSLIAIEVNLVNIVLSWILSGVDMTYGGHTLVNPFSFDLHVVGIALGTAIGYLWGALRTLWVLRRGVKDLRLHARDLSLQRHMVWRIVRIGVPNFFEGLAMWGVNLFVLSFIGTIAARMASDGGLQGAHIIAVQWEAFSFMPGFAIGTAAGALAGQYLGAGNPELARKAILTCAMLAMLVMGSCGLVFITQSEALTKLISHEQIHLLHTPNLLRICGAVQIFFALTMVFRNGLRGVGDANWTFVITTVSSYGVRLPAAYLLGVHWGYGLEGIWFALCGEFTIRCLLFTARFMHGGWKRLKV